MKYRKDKYGNELSQLGYGCMRFTGKAGRRGVEAASIQDSDADSQKDNVQVGKKA